MILSSRCSLWFFVSCVSCEKVLSVFVCVLNDWVGCWKLVMWCGKLVMFVV